MKSCVQCGFEADDEFCPKCGQKQNIPRLTLKFFIEDFFDRIYGLNGAVPNTVIGMYKNPGSLIKAYLSGVRRKYVGPVGYYFMVFALFLLLFPVLGIEINEYMPKQESFNAPLEQITGQEIEKELVEKQYKMRNVVFEKIQFFLVLWFPFLALWALVFFRSSGYNFLENMIFGFYTQAQAQIFSIIGVLVFAITDFKIIVPVSIASFIYFQWSAATFYKDKSKVKLVLKAMAMFVLSYFTFIIVAGTLGVMVGKVNEYLQGV